jgi:hypothetical protein
MTARLPTPGGDNNNWGTVLNDYLQHSIASDGTLITSATNSYTGTTNTNLANSSQPGLVQLAGDLTTPVTAPKVVGLQGVSVATTMPTDGQVLAYATASGKWQPTTPTAGGGSIGNIDGGNSASVYGGVAIIDCGGA